MSTPTLHTDEPGLCPPGHQILELATSAPYAAWRTLRDTDRRRYNLEKKRVRDRLREVVGAEPAREDQRRLGAPPVEQAPLPGLAAAAVSPNPATGAVTVSGVSPCVCRT